MTDKKELKGLGGWLILVGIGVVITPIRLLVVYLPLYLPLFQDGTWAALTTPGSDYYTPYFGALLIGEILFNTAMLLASCCLIYLFFARHHRFPRLYIALNLTALVFIPLDAWLVTQLFPQEPMFDADTAKEFARSLFACLVWVPYMLVSKRVKATFIEKRPASPAMAAEPVPGD
ncbi:DUF2569 domain-containing protein [Gallaecimonas sp. GXIMD4217]|uniref:DUF2569 domain-containing protein n=1 Tax=Gallaecimonas sp. GXIMD4217 TaxID=3131927 RepID=UPI00311AFD68